MVYLFTYKVVHDVVGTWQLILRKLFPVSIQSQQFKFRFIKFIFCSSNYAILLYKRTVRLIISILIFILSVETEPKKELSKIMK